MLTIAAVLATLLVLFSLLDRSELAARQGAVLGAVTGVAAHFAARAADGRGRDDARRARAGDPCVCERASSSASLRRW